MDLKTNGMMYDKSCLTTDGIDLGYIHEGFCEDYNSILKEGLHTSVYNITLR